MGMNSTVAIQFDNMLWCESHLCKRVYDPIISSKTMPIFRNHHWTGKTPPSRWRRPSSAIIEVCRRHWSGRGTRNAA
jgi:hypothetical protein